MGLSIKLVTQISWSADASNSYEDMKCYNNMKYEAVCIYSSTFQITFQRSDIEVILEMQFL